MQKKNENLNTNDDDFLISYSPFLPNYDQKSETIYLKDGKKKK